MPDDSLKRINTRRLDKWREGLSPELKRKILEDKWRENTYWQEKYSLDEFIQEKMNNEYFIDVDNLLDLETVFSSDLDDGYIGMGPSYIKDDETGAQFKERVQKLIKEVFKDRTTFNFDWHEEAYYS